jgi:hypothetical protein
VEIPCFDNWVDPLDFLSRLLHIILGKCHFDSFPLKIKDLIRHSLDLDTQYGAPFCNHQQSLCSIRIHMLWQCIRASSSWTPGLLPNPRMSRLCKAYRIVTIDLTSVQFTVFMRKPFMHQTALSTGSVSFTTPASEFSLFVFGPLSPFFDSREAIFLPVCRWSTSLFLATLEDTITHRDFWQPCNDMLGTHAVCYWHRLHENHIQPLAKLVRWDTRWHLKKFPLFLE